MIDIKDQIHRIHNKKLHHPNIYLNIKIKKNKKINKNKNIEIKVNNIKKINIKKDP